MRCVGGLSALVLCALFGAPVWAQAQQTCTNPDALGVARTIEVDTTGGPWLGAPHGDRDLLRPGEVVLTFDDGPVPRTTRPILAALAAECTKATFFMVGKMAAAYPEVVREVAAQGHTVATHTWSHPNLGLASVGQTKAQIETAIAAVKDAAGAPVAAFFRYPYLSSTRASVAYLKSRNVAQVAVDIDSLDYLTRNPQSVVSRTMAQIAIKTRGIILLHDIHASTARAVPGLLARLKEKGIKIVHLRPKAPVESIEIAEAFALSKGAAADRQPLRKPARLKAPQAHRTQDGDGLLPWPPW